MLTTKNLGLQIPEQDDIYDVDYVRHNMEIIDGLMDSDVIRKAFYDVFNFPGYAALDGFNVAVPFYSAFSFLGGSADDYGTVRVPEYDNAFKVASGFFAEFNLTSGSVTDYSSGTVAYIRNEADVGPAFNYVFGRGITEQFSPMSSESIEAAIETRWDGTASVNQYALTPEEIQAAMDAQWNGETSSNPFAITASEISNITKQ